MPVHSDIEATADRIMKAVGKPGPDGKTVFNGDLIVPAIHLVIATMMVSIEDETEFEYRLKHTLAEIDTLSRRMRKIVHREAST